MTGVTGVQREARTGDLAIVDGGSGKLYLAPDEPLLAEYQRAREEYADSVQHLDAMRERPAETRDGRRVVLSANVGLLNDLRLVEQHGAEGVGLFRTELLAIAHRGFPSEEEQNQLYRRVTELMGSRPVTIRTLDLGGDKGIPNIGLGHEDNPQLGCRSIRLTLENRRAFHAQLRAILRASAARNVRLLLPMISAIGELREARSALVHVQEQLRETGRRLRREDARRHDDRGAFRRDLRRRAGRRVRLLQHRNQRPHPVHPGRRSGQRAGRAPLRSRCIRRCST